LIAIDFVIVSEPNPPGSIQSISPHADVFVIAPAHVLQGAVRLHGLESSPTPETHVRVACALAATVENKHKPKHPSTNAKTIRMASSARKGTTIV
jgi:hypothetical protein